MSCHVMRGHLNSCLVDVEMEDDQLFFGQDRIHKDDKYFTAVINNCQQCQE